MQLTQEEINKMYPRCTVCGSHEWVDGDPLLCATCASHPTEYDRLKAMKDRILEEQRIKTNFDKVGEFNDACGCHRESKPAIPPKEVWLMRIRLINEEAAELCDACIEEDIVEVADALADLLYVVYGAAHTFGLDIQPIFDEVHRSNMAKVGPDGKVKRREDGKILKPDGWKPPAIRAFVEMQKQAHNELCMCNDCLRK